MATDFLAGNWNAVMPEIVVLLFALLAPIVALWDRDRRAGMQQFALIALGGAFLLTLGSITRLSFTIPIADIAFSMDFIGADIGGVYAVTEASQALKLIFLGAAFLAVLGAGRTLKGKVEEDWGEFHSLLLFATFGMMVVASSRDLILLVIGIETASLSSYLLAAFRRDKVGAEAGLKYFAVGAVSSGMTVFAVSLLYGMAGTTDIATLGESILLGGDFDGVSMLASVLLLAGLGFKISSVPFHAWAPDVYSGASPAVAGFLAAASKAMGFAAVFTVFLVGLGSVKANWEIAVAVIAVASMLVGNLIALQQTSIRRMLAYSSIAQAGYLLIALAVGTTFAVGGGILHLFVNAAMKLGAFLAVGGLLMVGVQDHVDGWRGLGRRAPLIAFAMTLFLLSMAGIPPLGGFASKFVLFSGAVQAGIGDGNGWLLLLAVAAVLNSALSLFYYLRVIRAMYVDSPGEPEGAGRATAHPTPALATSAGHDVHAEGTVHGHAPEGSQAHASAHAHGRDDEGHGMATPARAPKPERLHIGRGATAAVVVCALLVVVVGVWPEPFLQASMDAARSLLSMPVPEPATP